MSEIRECAQCDGTGKICPDCNESEKFCACPANTKELAVLEAYQWNRCGNCGGDGTVEVIGR